MTCIKHLCGLAAIGLAVYLAQNTAAQDSHWSGLGYNGLWADPTNWTPVGVPASEVQGLSTNGGNVWLQPVANGQNTVTITNGEVETPGIRTNTAARPPWNTIFGPETGMTLNIYGSLSYDWIIAPVQANPAPGQRTHINMYGNSYMTTSGAALGLGDQWWYWAAPYLTMNLYGNSFVNITNGAGFWLGGHLNLYDNAVFSVAAGGYVNMDNNNALSDGTRSIVMGGGKIMLPTGWTVAGTAGENSGTVYDWIARGVLRAYGKFQDTNDLSIVDDGTNTIVTPVALGGALQQIYFQPLLRSTMTMGMFQQAVLVGDYPSVTGVLLSSDEPGLSRALTGYPAYSSSNPGVATIDTNGLVRAVGPGTTTLSATLGALTSINTVTVTVVPVTASLVHRYSFSETSGTTTADSVGGAGWDGTLVGGATLGGGQVTLDGASGYVLMPAGLVTGLDEVTVEAWASFGTPISTNSYLFAFGNNLDGTNGMNYITVNAKAPPNGRVQAQFGQGSPGSGAQRNATGLALDGQTNMQIVAVYHPYAGSQSLYTNGVLAASTTIFNNMLDPVAYAGPTYTNGSIVPYTLGTTPLSLLGHSLYLNDPMLNGSIDELRIYSGALTAGRISADYLLGPNALIGTTTNVSLLATLSDTNIVLSWTTNSALVNVLATTTLGPSASWTAVTGSMAIVGPDYQMTLPASGSARYFRLSE